MKFWQKRKKLEISETDQVYKAIYLGNVITSWAKGESTLEKPLTTLWKNYCNSYANIYASKNALLQQNGSSNSSSSVNRKSSKTKYQSKQILMKLTICNQGLKALTREFGLTEYWANRITFCGQCSNFPRIFAWIYRHEGKKMKQELRVHACLINKQVNVAKMITSLQTRLNAALDEFKREKKLRENSRRVSMLCDQLNLYDELAGGSEFSDEYDEIDFRLNMVAQYSAASANPNGIDDDEKGSLDLSQISITSSTKGQTLARLFTRNLSQSSLNSNRSKSSTSSCSRKSTSYDENSSIPIRKQLLIKGSKNFKEPLERTKSAPKLCSILEEFSSEEEQDVDDDDFFSDKLQFDDASFSISDEHFTNEEELLRQNFRPAHIIDDELDEAAVFTTCDQSCSSCDLTADHHQSIVGQPATTDLSSSSKLLQPDEPNISSSNKITTSGHCFRHDSTTTTTNTNTTQAPATTTSDLTTMKTAEAECMLSSIRHTNGNCNANQLKQNQSTKIGNGESCLISNEILHSNSGKIDQAVNSFDFTSSCYPSSKSTITIQKSSNSRSSINDQSRICEQLKHILI